MARNDTARGDDPRARCELFGDTTHPVNSLMDLQAQRLVRNHHINPAIALTIAGLAWCGVAA